MGATGKNLLTRVSAHPIAWRLSLCLSICLLPAQGQSLEAPTPAQREIQKQGERLSSQAEEDRRDALMRLGAMHRAEASRVALRGLADSSPMVRAVAARAVLSLPVAESVEAITPLLNDREEFVRREAAYALGLTRSKNATAALIERLLTDKEDGVRAAAAVALGQIADDTSVVTLANVITGQTGRKGKPEKNEFVLRAVASALGQTRNPAGVPALVATLMNEMVSNDIRRQAAAALGQIGDPTAIEALNRALTSADPYLSVIASDSLKKIHRGPK